MVTDEKEKSWVKIVPAIILGGATVLAAMLPLYCSSQRRLEQATQTADSETDVLRKQLAGLESQVRKCEEEKAALANLPGANSHSPTPGAGVSGTEVVNQVVNTATLNARIGDVGYRVESAQHTGQELQVWLIATNQGANLEAAISYTSSLTDAAGNEHRQSARMAGGGRGGGDWFWVTFPHNVPTRFGLAFDSVPPTIKDIPYMRINMVDQGWLEFRHITVPYEASN